MALHIWTQPTEESFFEFQHAAHIIADEQRPRGGDIRIYQHDIFKVAFAGRKNAGPLIDLLRIQKVQHREVLYGEHFVHTFQAQATLAIEEIRNMGLLETSLARKFQPGKLPGFNALPQGPAQAFLKRAELHVTTIREQYSQLL